MVKPGKKKKKFIGKDEEKVTFHLVHRSQKDPLAADETAPQHVLQPMNKANPSHQDVTRRREEQRKFGIFFDDDYNYLQHLRDVVPLAQLETLREEVAQEESEDAEAPKKEAFPPLKEVRLQLPSSVFASEVEEFTGLLNKAAPLRGPQVDWDPDIVAALDGASDFEGSDNELDDDFVLQANNADGICDDDDGEASDDERSDVSESDAMLSLYDRFGHDAEETGSQFTNYSLSSSVIHRSTGLKSLDDRFEKLFEQYDDMEIGALDTDDIAGPLTEESPLFQQILKQFEEEKEIEKNHIKELEPDESMDHQTGLHVDPVDDAEDFTELVIEEPENNWDCESILSTYSTLYNHPRLITEPKKTKPIKVSKDGFPIDEFSSKNLTMRNLKQLDKQSHVDDDSGFRTCPDSNHIHRRKKDETGDEKKFRKLMVKEHRKERRVEKKLNKMAFKQEKKLQEKIMMNVQHNLQAIKLS